MEREMSQRDIFDRRQTDVARRSVITISYVNMTVYMLLFFSFSYLIFRHNAALYTTEFFIDLFLMLWMLAMSFATVIMYIGISARRADCVVPYLMMSIVTALEIVTCVFFRKDTMQVVLGAMVVAYIVITWYPIFVIHNKFARESVATCADIQTAVEQQPLSCIRNAATSYPDGQGNCQETATIYYSAPECEPPPSYECIMRAGLEKEAQETKILKMAKGGG